MELVNSIIGFITKLVKWWFIVMPWEQAIRVRKGNKVSVLKEGMYLKIPFIDTVYIQTTRLRMVDIPMQTISSKDGTCITIKSYISYAIDDIYKLYKTLYHPESTLAATVMGIISKHIRETKINDIMPQAIEELINNDISSNDYGIRDVNVKITSFAVVKTFRLIQDSSTSYQSDLKMNELIN